MLVNFHHHLHIAVCDDDPQMAEQNEIVLCRILDGHGMQRNKNYEIDVYHTPALLTQRLEQDPSAYDLLMLDIQLPDANGVELAHFLRSHNVQAEIIYVTDYPGFALDSFPTYPLEYLLKPVDEERLSAAIDRYLLMHCPPERLFLQTGNRVIPLEDILYLEISGRKTAVYTEEEHEMLSEPLSKLKEPLLAQGFCSSHFSYLVNLSHVKRVKRTAILLDNGNEIPVSRRYYQQLMERYIEHLK
ncbi:MAG: LytTR family DNA-binding domain-containing protein [Lachnospiraceae bacterium]|nr:LytTR family DNA-binding domain-containing protein [Lachnospiraceae bacterium]